MLSRHLDASSLAIKQLDFTDQIRHDLNLLVDAWVLADLMVEFGCDDSWKPGVALSSSANHHCVGACCIEYFSSFVCRCDVSIGDQRDLDGITSLANGVVFCVTLVHIASGSSVHGDCLKPKILPIRGPFLDR